MAEVLKVFHLAQEDGMAEVEVGRGGVETGFDAEGFALLGAEDDAVAEVLFADQFGEAFAKVGELFGRGGERVSHGVSSLILAVAAGLVTL